MDEATLITIALAAISLMVSFIIWIASTHAARIAKETESPDAILRKVDADAYERARQIYESAIQQLENEVLRLQQQLTEATRQVAMQARQFQAEISHLQGEIIRLHQRSMGDMPDPPGSGTTADAS